MYLVINKNDVLDNQIRVHASQFRSHAFHKYVDANMVLSEIQVSLSSKQKQKG
jgi:hypothetical protein